MITRKEWIAQTAREYNIHGTTDAEGNRIGFVHFESALGQAELDAKALEANALAPWQTPAPVLSDTAAKVVEADNAVVEAADTWANARHGQNEAAVIALYLAVLSRRDAIRDHRAAQPGGVV